ncbi:hypothetical protein LAV_00037 [Sphingobium phage Lacusarx]|uniref:Uncharacterized protein n=1 Tax=Sphingobium phage Lacusarx TaxID=1980139 RepID=A0A1W6DWP1_9CAUD|nr:hypothetical protein FDH44_gp037 [Sphingobium phage Lacusarx]ARK07437.1 hypothetical protein LAV_00037 [Sphingobium phage Lacusarx]
MRAVLWIGGITAAIVALVSLFMWLDVDRGACLAGHEQFHPGYMYMQYLSFDGGKTTTMIPQWVPDSTSYVCDEWEFPNGK